MHGLIAKAAREGGAAAVEFSLIAMLLFTLLLGILHFGLTFNRQQGLHAAAREGARLASLGNDVDDAAVFDRVRDAAPAFIIDPRWSGVGGDLDITIAGIDELGDPTVDWCKDSVSDGDGEIADERVQVTVGVTATAEDQYDFGLPLIGMVTPDLQTSATFQCEQERL